MSSDNYFNDLKITVPESASTEIETIQLDAEYSSVFKKLLMMMLVPNCGESDC